MNELILVLETGPSGTVRLRSPSSRPLPWDAEKLRQIEQELQRRYERLVKGAERTVTIDGRPFRIDVQETLNARQPRLVLTQVAETPVSASPDTRTIVVPWRDGFLAALEGLVEQTGPGPLYERSALRACIDELRHRLEQSPGEEATLFLATYLVTAESHFRPTDADLAGQYALALRALQRRTPRVADDLAPPPNVNGTTSRSFFGQVYSWLFGNETRPSDGV